MKKAPNGLMHKFRYVVLVLTCVALFGSMFIFDQPALLKEEIIEKFSPIYGPANTDYYFSYLYSFYSIPNIVLPLFGGFMSDLFGYKFMSFVFMLFIMLGQMIVYLGCHAGILKYMIFGRFLFGLGGESLGVTMQVIINKWFVGSELSFANSVNLSLIRSATVLNTIVSPRIAQHYGMTSAFAFGFLITVLSAGGLVLLLFIDSYIERRESQNRQNQEGILDNSAQVIDFNELLQKIITDISALPRLFWILTFIMTTFYTSVLIFISFSSPIIIELWLNADGGLEEKQNIAGELMGIPYICCTFLSPFIGIIIDKVGQRILFLLAGSVLVLLGQLSMLFFYPIFSMIFIGIAYALFASTIWTSIAYVVKQKQLGTAYGLMNSIQNFAFVLMPIFIAFISTEASSQVSVVLFFMILSCITLVIGIYLYQEDKERFISLNSSDQEQLTKYVETGQEEDGEEFQEEQIIESKQ